MDKASTVKCHLLLTVTSFFMIVMANKVMAQERMEEFNGPFASWVNVKIRFGAKGDGKTDDTKSFQLAIDSLSGLLQQFNQGRTGYSVIYIPRGIYKLTATLQLKGKMGIKIVGEDPVNTVFLWQGKDNDTVFWANGSAYFSLSRLSWDPGGRKNIEAVGMHWKETGNGTYAPEQVEFSDLIFNPGFAKGICGGTFGGSDGTGMNESEITIRRCTFNECSESGILIRGFNALDYWVWYCQFIKCKVGVTSSSGNYHIYKSYFNTSQVSDVYNINSYYTSVRYCFSENSAAFSVEASGSNNPFKRIFEGNTVTGIKNIGILYEHTGKITLLDNVFRAAAINGPKKFMQYQNSAPSHFDLLNLNNSIEGFPTIFSISAPSREFKGKLATFKKSGAGTVTSEDFIATFPPTPPYRQRVIYEVPVNSTVSQVQKIIDNASAVRNRAVVHFPFGRYQLSGPLIIPVNSDIQITGDGQLYASTLLHAPSVSFVNGAVFKIICPVTVSIKDIDFDLTGSDTSKGSAIALVNADQQGSTVIIDQFYADNDTSLFVKGYDYTLFQKTNSFFTTGNYVSGGKLVENGMGTMKVQSFGAQFANCTLEKNGTFIARDCWWEGASPVPLNFKGRGNFVLDGAMIAPRKLDSSVIVSIDDFAGKITLMDMYMVGSIGIKKTNPALQILAWNINFYYKKQPLAFITGKELYKGFFSGITTQCFNAKDPQCGGIISSEDRSANVNDPDAFFDTMTTTLRSALPVEYITKPAGVTNFYLSRVAVSAKYKTGIAFIK